MSFLRITSSISGWRIMNRQPEQRKLAGLLGLCAVIGIGGCGTPVQEPPLDEGENLQDFLEFLLDFETEEGEWLDPALLEI